MTRRSQRRRPVPRGRRYDDYDDYSYRAGRGGGYLTSIKRFFRTVAIIFITALGAIIFFLIVFLIAFNLTIFVQILSYALFVGAFLAILGIIYLIVRLITAMSHKISEASAARSKAKIEKERVQLERQRVQQARVHAQKGSVQVRSQEAKLYRDDYAFYQKHEQSGFPQNPRRTRNFRDDPYPDYPQIQQQSPYRTRNLREVNQEPLVRVLSQLSTPSDLEPAAVEETELEALGMPTKGQVFEYSDYKRYLKPGQRIIGIRKDGTVRVGSRQDFKITLVLGASSSGKSTTVLQECLCLVNEEGLLNVCDPGGFKPDSITQRMGELQNALMPGTRVALEHEDIMQNLERFRVELERRRRGASMDIPILLVIDELNGLLMDKEIKKDLTELIEKFAQQARGYNMYMVLCAQRASGLAAIRNSVISFVCHKCPEMEASKILPARYAKLTPQLGVGQTFVSDANGLIEALQQIYITQEDIVASVSNIASRASHYQPQKRGKKFYMAETEDLAPKKIQPVPLRPAIHTSVASAVWQDPADQGKPQHGYPALRRTRLQASGQQRPLRTTDDLDPALIADADGSPDDTVLVPEPPMTSPPQAVDQLNQFARLAQLRKQKK